MFCFIFISVCICLCLSVVIEYGHMSVGACGSQRDCVCYSWSYRCLRAALCGFWEPNLHLITKPFLQPLYLYVYDGFHILIL